MIRTRGWMKTLLVVGLVVGAGVVWWQSKYQTAEVMVIGVEELRPQEYAADPAIRSEHYDKYSGRQLRLVQRDGVHFDFIFEPEDLHVARVAFENVDLSLFIPIAPVWTRGDRNLEVIALVDREWNRQQVQFAPGSEHLDVQGGDGFEVEHLVSAELSRNCLNAGLWEVLLYTEEDGEKALYYHGWFTFPLGHYRNIFNAYNASSYWKHWFRLEHWFDPEGTVTHLEPLRQVVNEKELSVHNNPEEEILIAGEQKRKARIFNAEGIRCWGDLCKEYDRAEFATFVAPGRYDVDKPWGNRFDLLTQVEQVTHRKVVCPATDKPLDEIEVLFRGSENELHRFIVSGIELDALPQLTNQQYHQGLYLPMGIGVGPFSQTYEELVKNPPYKSPYFSVLLDDRGRWINHHKVGVDGPVLHRDSTDPNLLHLYLLSYERQTLVGHYVISLD